MRISNVMAILDDLKATERKLHRLAEADCNTGLTPRQASRQTNLKAEATELVTRLANQTGLPLRVRFNGDPRGSAVKLINTADSGDRNDMGGEISL